MSHLDSIKEVYDKVGIDYVVRTKSNERGIWSYLFLCNKNSAAIYETEDLDRLCRLERFMEFKDGSIASY